MTELRFQSKTNINKGITTVFSTVVMLLLFSMSCSNENKDVVSVTYDPETTYTLKTTDVYTLISDSGLVRYRLVADEWYVYGKAQEPFWYFPEGFYVEKFDTLFRAESSVKSDTAYHWEKKALWKLINNVEIVNQEGDSIETSLMFWDQNEGKLYSDKFVRIVRADGTIITGIGFETAQEMSKYILYQSAGEFAVNDSAPSDSTRTDSTAVNTPRPGTAPRRPSPPPHNPIMINPSRRESLIQDTLQMQLLEEEMNRLEEEMPEIENSVLPELLEEPTEIISE
ncbi:MAG: LPS export ABC transporter periplasmic protein LptC [Tannerellaceae bacterium]|nr:LPS export ABC transporter periplasmic protein LptC [Tannerellaceae bacterium]